MAYLQTVPSTKRDIEASQDPSQFTDPDPFASSRFCPKPPASSEQDVLNRQRERGVDNIGYSLSRTVRSCIHYKASLAPGAVGAVGACSRYRRSKYLGNAMSMFDGERNHGFPAMVAETLKL